MNAFAIMVMKFFIAIGCGIAYRFNGGYHTKACRKYLGTSSVQGL